MGSEMCIRDRNSTASITAFVLPDVLSTMILNCILVSILEGPGVKFAVKLVTSGLLTRQLCAARPTPLVGKSTESPAEIEPIVNVSDACSIYLSSLNPDRNVVPLDEKL